MLTSLLQFQAQNQKIPKELSAKNKWSFRTAKLFLLLAVPYFSKILLDDNNFLTVAQAGEIITCATSY